MIGMDGKAPTGNVIMLKRKKPLYLPVPLAAPALASPYKTRGTLLIGA